MLNDGNKNAVKPVLREDVLNHASGPPAWWSDLFSRAQADSIFLSPQWVATWLDIYGMDFSGKALSWWHDDACIAGVMLLLRPAKLGPFPITLAILNTAGEIDENAPFIEYNDVLCQPGYEEIVLDSLASYLAQQSWDQLYLAGYTESSLIARLQTRTLPGRWDSIAKSSPYINLASIGDGGLDKYFSSNTRAQIRRSVKLYEERGGLRIGAAQDLDESLKYLDALAELHRAAWLRRGQPGGFRSPRFIQFHKNLVQRLLPERAVELLRVTAGDQTVGYIYNFLRNGKVYFYQSGFAYEEDAKLKPGLVTHYLAAQDYWKRGFVEYDFMAGDARYKTSLAKSVRTLHWSWVERSNARMKLVKIARKAKHFLRRP
jgi:hypothetical protein